MSKKTKTNNVVNETTAVTPVVDEAYALSVKNRWIDAFNNALGVVKRDTWAVAQVLYDTVNDAEFEIAFGSMENYGETIGMTKSNISKMVNAVSVRKYLAEYEIGQEMAVHQLSETLPLYKEGRKQGNLAPYTKFIKDVSENERMTQKEIRELTKQALNDAYGIVKKAKVVEEDGTPVETTEPLSMGEVFNENDVVETKTPVETFVEQSFAFASDKMKTDIDRALTALIGVASAENAEANMASLADIMVNFLNAI